MKKSPKGFDIVSSVTEGPPTNYGAALDLYTALSLHDELWEQADRLRRKEKRDKSLSAAGKKNLLARADELVMFADWLRNHLCNRIFFNGTAWVAREPKKRKTWIIRR